jgi:hypothetical protein
MKARLYVRNPLDVNFVAEVEIPPFRVLPEALVWGQRYFQLAKRIGPGREALLASDAISGSAEPANYIEGLAFAVDAAQAPRAADKSPEWVKSSLRVMTYCVEHGERGVTSHCTCRLRAARLFDDDGPVFKAAHDGLDAIAFLATSLAIATGAVDESQFAPELLANIAKMEPGWVENMIEEAIGGLKALVRGTRWEKPA